jgi:dihydroflavonol-4-reductase
LDVEIVKADILDPTALRSAFKSAGSIFHFAAAISLGNSEKGRLLQTNVTGALNAAQAALDVGAQRYIHCSSIHAYDLTAPHMLITERTHRVGSEHPIYDQSKALGESAVRKVIRAGLPGVIINPSGVIGPYDHRPSRIGRVLIDLAARNFPALVPGGFDWIDVRDVCKGALAAEERGRIGENYLLAGEWHSPRDLAAFGEEVTRVAPPRLTIPMWLAQSLYLFSDFLGHVRQTEPLLHSDGLAALRASRRVSQAKAQKELGHKPRSIRDSVHDACRWFNKSGMLERPLSSINQNPS